MSSPNKDSEKLIELVAGPVTALFAGGDLRTIRIDECEIIDRIYFALEMIGWKGIMERASGSLLPSFFPSHPGELFPLYHLFAAFADVAGGEIDTVAITDPASLGGFAVRKDSLLRLFVANYKPVERRVRIEGFSGAFEAHQLDSEAAVARQPFRVRGLNWSWDRMRCCGSTNGLGPSSQCRCITCRKQVNELKHEPNRF